MKWRADQALGYFGYSTDGQQLHVAKVDWNEAVSESREMMSMFLTSQAHSESPAFSGGVLDSWPAFAVDGLAICKAELARVRAYLQTSAVTP